MRDRIERELVLDVAADRVWSALVTPEELSSWFGDAVSIDVAPGGRVRAEGDDRRFGVVEVVEPGRRLVFRWWPDRPFTVADGSRVEVTIDEEEGTGTRVRIVEERLSRPPLGFHVRRPAAVGAR